MNEDLSYIDGWVEAVSHIHDHVTAQDGEISSQSVHLHFTGTRTIRKVVVHSSLASGPGECDVWSFVETLG